MIKRVSIRQLIRHWWKKINMMQQLKGETKYGTYRPQHDRRDNLVERMKELVDAPAYLRMEEAKLDWQARALHVKRGRRWLVVLMFRALARLDFCLFALTVVALRLRDWATKPPTAAAGR